jgi:hypothetical protein
MWFFEYIAHLPPDQFRRRLHDMSDDLQIEALGAQISALSRNVSRKHAWVNRGFVLAGVTLILFLIGGLSHAGRVWLLLK